MNDPDATMSRVADTSSDGRSAEAVVVGETFEAVVEAAFEALPEKFHRVVELIDIDGLSYQEAADVLGVPVGTIMSRLSRARGRIRDRLTVAGLVPRRGK